MSGTLSEAVRPVTPKRSKTLTLPAFATPIIDRYYYWADGRHSPSLDIRKARSSYIKIEDPLLPRLGDSKHKKGNSNQSLSAFKRPQALKEMLTPEKSCQSDDEELLVSSPESDDEDSKADDEPTADPSPATHWKDLFRL